MIMFELTISRASGPIPLRGVRRFALTDREGEPPRLIAEVLADASDSDLADLLRDGRVELKIDQGEGLQRVHHGRVAKLARRGRLLKVWTAPASSALDRDRRTRTFAPRGTDPCPIADLPGLAQALRGVDGLALLDAVVPAVTQYRETDLKFVRRLAWLSGKFVRFDDDSVTVHDGRPRLRRSLRRSDILDESVCWTMSMRSSSAGCLAWDEARGLAPTEPAVANPPDHPAASPGFDAARSFEGAADVAYPLTTPGGRSLSDLAAQRASGRGRHAFSWKGGLRDLRLRPGDLVELPAGSVTTAPLFVAERTLRFDGRRRVDCLVNHVTLRVAPGGRPGGPSSDLILHRAEVVHAIDREKRGRIAVRYPWMAAGAFVMATVPQDSSGAFSMPEAGDWVHLLLMPRSVALPVVLGSTSRGDRPAPSADGAERVEWRLPGGFLLRFDRANRRVEIGFLDGETLRVGLRIDMDSTTVIENLKLKNNLTFE